MSGTRTGALPPVQFWIVYVLHWEMFVLLPSAGSNVSITVSGFVPPPVPPPTIPAFVEVPNKHWETALLAPSDALT